MQVWKVLHAARCKCRTQKSRQKSPSGHHSTTLSGYIFAIKACIDNREKKLVKKQYPLYMSSQYGELWPTSGWDSFVSLGHPRQFQRVSRLGSVTAWHSSSGRTEGATYIRQGGHHFAHWPTFLVYWYSLEWQQFHDSWHLQVFCCDVTKHTCSDSLNLKPPSPPYPLQDFKALYKCCIIIIIIITMLGSAIQSIMVTWWQSNRLHWHLVRKQQWSRVINYYHSAIKTLYFCYLFDQIRLYTVVFLQ